MIFSLIGNIDVFEREKDNFMKVYLNSNLRGIIINFIINMYIESGDIDKVIEFLNNLSLNIDNVVVKEINIIKIIILKL